MLNAKFRLKRKIAFSATYRLKNSYYKNGIVLWVGRRKKDLDEITKVGFVVSKKTHKRAVKRNRLKRLMREGYRILLKSNEIPQDYLSFIFVGFEKALSNDYLKTKDTIQYLVNNVKDKK